MNLVHDYRNDEKLWDSVVETRKSFFANLDKNTMMKDVCDMNSGLINKKLQQILTSKLLRTLALALGIHNNIYAVNYSFS